jgi:DNA mismatch repair protein MutL
MLMPSKIRVLSDQTINKIAAGEVIENPASVVKELVENSIDAGATDICVEIRGGGRQFIRVTDNGCGMSADDALLCLERHATSKIKTVEDIYEIASMGFRGEAIPSIASISKFMILTCPQSENENSPTQGTLVSVEGGQILQCCPAACPPGTTIEVKSLFFNVPVRKKFQKSPTYDTAEILKMLSLLALGHPNIKFQLISNQESLLNVSSPIHKSSEELLEERIKAVLGKEFLHGACAIEGVQDKISLRGWIGLPAYTRHNRTGQYLFINKRAVSSPIISYAVREGYGPSLDSNRYPVFVIHLDIPGDLIDINVHPQKKEVRLRQDQPFKEFIIRCVEQALQQQGASPFTNIAPAPFSFTLQTEPTSLKLSVEQEPPPFFSFAKKEVADIKTPIRHPIEQQILFQNTHKPNAPKVLAPLNGYLLIDPFDMPQFAADSLCLVDQRCAHARIIYEKLEALDGNFSTQALLIPYSFEAAPDEAAFLKEHLESLNLLGLALKEFGPHTFIIEAVPSFFGKASPQDVLKELLENSRDFSDPLSFQKESRRLIAQSASRSAISKTKKLTLEEAQALTEQLMQCQNPYHCPFGKNIIFQIPFEELSKFQNRYMFTGYSVA